MTKGELIKLLIDDWHTMSTQIDIVAEIPHKDEQGKECSGYAFRIKGLDRCCDIVIDADWLLKKDMSHRYEEDKK